MRPVANILLVLMVIILGLWLLTVAFELNLSLLLLAAPVAAVFFILTSRRNTA